jgi:tyrosine-protein kinase Etk/Wzc
MTHAISIRNPRAASFDSPPEDQIDLRALLGTLLDHRRLIAGVTIACFLLGLIYVLVATPVYQANAMVQVEQSPTLPGLTAVAEAVGASNPESTDALSILTSESVLKPAVDNLDLNTVVGNYQIPVLGSLLARLYTPAQPGDVASPWLGLAGYNWGGSQLRVGRLQVPDALLDKKITLVAGKNGAYTLWLDSAIPFVHDKLLLHGTVGTAAEGSGVTALVTRMHANPGMRFHVTRNYEMTTIHRLQNAIKAKQASQGANVIQLSYDSYNPQRAVAVLKEVTKAYLAQNVGRNSAQAANSLKFVNEQLPVVKKRLEDAQAALNAYQIKAHSVDVPMQTQSMLTQIDTLDASIQQLQTQKIAAARLYTPANPAYQAIEKQIGALSAQKASIQKQMNTLPDTQRELLRLNGNVNVLNPSYNGLLNEEQQLEIAQAGTVGTTRIVDQPSVDITRPVKPRKLMTLAGTTFIGAFFAVGFVMLRQLLRNGVEDPAEIEQLGLPVFTAIPLSEQQLEISERGQGLFARRRQRLLALAAPEDLAAEALRSLRTSLRFAQRDASNNVVMICGASSKAGKTFVSANLAAVNAQAGQRVLLIDANLRDAQLHTILGGRPDNGLSELLADRIVDDEAIRQVEGVDNLHFIPAGRRPTNPSELLMHHTFAALLRRLSPRYDMVVIDSPPILAVTDAAIIGHHAGTNLLVVRFGLNHSREVELAMQRLQQSGVAVNGVVFNGMEKRSGGYSTYGYFGYGTDA